MKERALPGAVRTEQSGDAWTEGERNVIDRDHVAVPARDMVDLHRRYDGRRRHDWLRRRDRHPRLDRHRGLDRCHTVTVRERRSTIASAPATEARGVNTATHARNAAM